MIVAVIVCAWPVLPRRVQNHRAHPGAVGGAANPLANSTTLPPALAGGAPPGAKPPPLWSDDYSAARKAAQREHRLLVVQFCSEERSLCQRMRDQTVADPGVARTIALGFVAVWLDAERAAALFQRFVGERGIMATCVLHADEDVVALLEGFAEADVYREFLDQTRAEFPSLARAWQEVLRRPEDAASLLRLGDMYERLGSVHRARDAYERILGFAQAKPSASRPNLAAAAHERLARLDADRGRNLEARAHLDAAGWLDPAERLMASGRLALTEALVLFNERRLDDARRRLEPLALPSQAGAETARALTILGIVQHELSEDPAALASLARVRDGAAPACWRAAANREIAHIRDPDAHRH